MGKCLFMRKGETHTSPKAGLPNGYTELTHIESTGTQYIDTEFKPNNNTRLVVKFKTSQSDAARGIAVVDTAWLNNAFGIFTGNLEYGNQYIQYALNDGVEHTVDVKADGQFFKDGELIWTATSTEFQALYNLTLFCLNRSNTKQYYSESKIYSCQIYDNGTLVRDFIPCINPSGEIGLYDTVNKKFYGNNGTGVFIGSEVA